MEEGEGTSRRTCVNEPWTWTTVWGLTVGAGVGAEGWAEKGKGGEIGTTVIE